MKFKLVFGTLILITVLGAVLVLSNRQARAACNPPSGKYGGASSTFETKAAGNYRVWARMWAPGNGINSFRINIDDGTDRYCGIVVGNGNAHVPDKEWVWIDWINNDPTNKIDVNLSKGTHDITFGGHEGVGIRVDRILFLQDGCLPEGDGSNCVVGGGQGGGGGSPQSRVTPCGTAPVGYNIITSNSSVIKGTQGNDYICAGNGKNKVLGYKGNDIIYGRGSGDTINGGPGQDTIYGGILNDVIRGGEHADTIKAGNGIDTVHGGSGPDDVHGGGHRDSLNGNGQNDILKGGKGPDTLRGGPGKDTLIGGPGNNKLFQ